MSSMYQVYSRNQTHYQIGDNTNLFDWTYVGNVALAHLLAADKLSSAIPPTQKLDSDPCFPRQITPEEQTLISIPLPSINLTTGSRPIPTCEARPLGPYITLPPNAQKIEKAFQSASVCPLSSGPVIRSRFDPLSVESLGKLAESPLQVAGQAFFITNGEPIYFWDFPRAVWNLLDAMLESSTSRKSRGLIILPKAVGLLAATGAEWVGWLIGKEPTFTRFKVAYSCATRWHNIEKARRVLGYEPEVGLGEGVRRMVEWWVKEESGGKH
jgi:sterol-4alpha-carboxylate 3-dehydrogenase (decarboxylating)